MQTQNILNRARLIRLVFAFAALGIAVSVARSMAISHSGSSVASSGIADQIAYNLTRAGFTTLIALSLCLLFFAPLKTMLRGTKDWTILWMPLAISGNVVVEKLGKTLLDWNRPTGERNGFPSGHAMFAFMLAFLVAEKYPKLAPIFYGAAVAISWARVEAGAHYPYQVVGGALFGTVIGWAISHFARVPQIEVTPRDKQFYSPIPRV